MDNNQYLEEFEGHPWYPIIKSTNEKLEKLIPGYRITQIKEKFGGLRYYFEFPNEIPVKPEWPAYDSREKIVRMAHEIVAYAEAWVDGFEGRV